MKKILFLSVIICLVQGIMHSDQLLAQAPQKMSYQAVIRNAGGELVQNTLIGMRIQILQTSEFGAAVYVETHTPTTNTNGLVTLEIGSGSVVLGTFSGINWSAGPYYLKTEADVSGGTSYSITGVSQILSVPYALQAKTAANYAETDPGFIGWDRSTGISITESQISDLGSYIETETQTIADVASIGNSVNAQLKNLTDPTDAQDAATKAYVDALLTRIEELEIKALGFTDSRDGMHYKAVKIGNQVWMAENLKYLPSVVGPSSGSATVSYYYVYGYDGSNVNDAKATTNYTTYGVLYNWPAAMNGAASSSSNPSEIQGVCPAGWHLPSDAEWTQLTDYLGGLSAAGGKLKEVGTIHWKSPNTDATNETDFTALPGGSRDYLDTFYLIYYHGYWWSATEYNTDDSWFKNLEYNNGIMYSGSVYKAVGFSVRCVRD